MSLMPVYYNTWNTKKPKKMKFKSSEEKAMYMLAKESEYGIAKKRRFVGKTPEVLTPKVYVRETTRHPSRGNGIGAATKPDAPVYTGTKMIGIGTLHKSNAVPIFSDEDAKDQAAMRR